MNRNDLSIRFGDFPDDGFQAILEFAAVFGARDERAHIERYQPLVLEPFRHIALHDANGQTFRNRRFPHPGFSDQHGVVFGPAGKNLQDAPDFLVAPDNGVDAALPCQLDEITGQSARAPDAHCFPVGNSFGYLFYTDKCMFQCKLCPVSGKDTPLYGPLAHRCAVSTY